MSTQIHSIELPRQRLAYKKKTKSWRKKNVDYADKHSFYHNESIRQTLENKIINFNLFNGIVDVRDMTPVVNPYALDANFIPDNIPHHPIIVPKIELLVGEESKRRFDWSIVVTNPDAVSKKEEDKKKYLDQVINEMLQQNYTEEELDKKLKELEKFMKYSWQDIREKMATQIMKHYWLEQEFEHKFLKGLKNVFISSEEIYQVDIEHGEPTMNLLNNLKVHAVQSGKSDKIEDASIIIIEDHWSRGRIIDVFHDQLKEKDIDAIENYGTTESKGEYVDNENHVTYGDGLSDSDVINSWLGIAEVNGHSFSSNYTDDNGNIRVFRVYWKSLKKIKKIKYYDEYGEAQEKIASEEYIVDKDRGEEETAMWVNEWWEGTKIGKDIYLQMKPRTLQYNRVSNPSYCHPGIIGQVYNTNQGRGVSLIDRVKNHQYLYDAVWDRTNKAIATNYGKIMEVDIAKIPDNWEMEKWMHFAVVNKIAIVDSFKEGNKGASTGKLAGVAGNTSGGRSIDMETGNYIQQHINLLEFIKMEMGDIAGVTRQREGQVENRETKGGIERSVAQSSHITEYWFAQHEKVKLRVMAAFLDTAKFALKGKNKKVQYILDDQTIQMLNIDGNEFSECDYGLMVANTQKSREMEEALKGFAQAHMQNGGSLKTIMDIYFSQNLSDMRRKIEASEEEMYERQNENQKEQLQLQREQMAKEEAFKQAELDLDDIMNQRDNATKLAIAGMSKEGEGEETPELDLDKFEVDTEVKRKDLLLKMKALDNDMKKHRDNLEVKKKQISAQKVKAKTTK